MYNIKLYNNQKVFIKTLSPKKVSTNYGIVITKDIWWGDFSFDYFDDGIQQGDIVEVFYDSAKLVYRWFVDTKTRYINEKWDYHNIRCTGTIWWLNYAFHGGTTYTNQTPNTILNSMLDVAESQWYEFDRDIDTFANQITIKTNSTDTVLQAIKSMTKINPQYFFITDKVYFRMQGINHILTFQKEISSIQIEQSSRELYNHITIRYGISLWSSYVIEDSASQTAYWIRKIVIDDSKIQNEATAIVRANKEINDRKNPKLNTKIRVNRSYDLESFLPGDTIEIRNIDLWIQNKTIDKVSYTKDYVDLDIDWIIDFDHTIASLKS